LPQLMLRLVSSVQQLTSTKTHTHTHSDTHRVAFGSLFVAHLFHCFLFYKQIWLAMPTGRKQAIGDANTWLDGFVADGRLPECQINQSDSVHLQRRRWMYDQSEQVLENH